MRFLYIVPVLKAQVGRRRTREPDPAVRGLEIHISLVNCCDLSTSLQTILLDPLDLNNRVVPDFACQYLVKNSLINSFWSRGRTKDVATLHIMSVLSCDLGPEPPSTSTTLACALKRVHVD